MLGGEQGSLSRLHGSQHAPFQSKGSHFADATHGIHGGYPHRGTGLSHALTAAAREPRGPGRNHERTRHEQQPHADGQTWTQPPQRHQQYGQQHRGTRHWQQNAEIKAVQGLDVAHQASKHVAAAPIAQATGGPPGQSAKEPHPQVRQRPEHCVVRHQALDVAQHHTGWRQHA